MWQLYVVWTVLGVVMAATLYEAAFAAVTAAFGAAAARRGIAVVVFAGGLASTVFWPLTGLLVQEVGWRDACTVLAVMNALCAVPHAILLPGANGRRIVRRTDIRPGVVPEPGLLEACRQPRFWGLALVYAALGAGSSAVAVHLVPLLQERGAGAAAAALAGLVGVAQVAGRVAEFAGAGRLSLRQVGAMALAALPVAFALLAWGAQPILLAMAVILYGAANGTMTIVRGALPAQMFGAAHYGAVAGGLAACGAFARSIGPLAVAWLWEWGGGYAPAMLALALLATVAVVAFTAATRRC
jgi:predicted MFS family arabinose efflux permease